MRLTTYESAVILKSGPHGCSVIAAPPTDVAPLEHDDALALLGEQAGGDEAVVATADHDDVERFLGASGAGHRRRLRDGPATSPARR